MSTISFTFAPLFTSVVAKVHNVETDVTALPEASLAKIFAYGLQRIINDASGAGDTPDEKLALALKKRDALLSGVVGRTPRAAKPGEDPLTAMVRRIATKDVEKALKEKGIEASDEFFAGLVERRMTLAEVIARAEAAIAAKTVKVPEVDLSDL